MYLNPGETGQARVSDVRHDLQAVGQSQAHQAPHQTDGDLWGVSPGLLAEGFDEVEGARSVPRVVVRMCVSNHIAKSSAYMVMTTFPVTAVTTSWTMMLKSSGAITEPCGTPILTVFTADMAPFHQTCIERLDRNVLM